MHNDRIQGILFDAEKVVFFSEKFASHKQIRDIVRGEKPVAASTTRQSRQRAKRSS